MLNYDGFDPRLPAVVRSAGRALFSMRRLQAACGELFLLTRKLCVHGVPILGRSRRQEGLSALGLAMGVAALNSAPPVPNS